MTACPLSRAIEIVGSQTKLGDAIGVSQQRIWSWLHNLEGKAPAEYVIPIEDACGGAVARWELRPDIYPKPKGRAA